MLAPIVLGDVYDSTRRETYTHDEARLDSNFTDKNSREEHGPGETGGRSEERLGIQIRGRERRRVRIGNERECW